MDVRLRGKNKQTVPGKDVKAIKKSVKANGSEVLKFENEPKKFKNKRKFKAGGLIYLGRIPHGFYEDQMTAYFNQFGKVITAIVPRSKKTGRSKGYGFVEFEDEEVAKIAAETMNNYLMYNKIVQCRYIPPEERKKSVLTVKNTGCVMCPKVLNRIETTRKKRESLRKLDQSAYQEKTQKKMAEFKQFFEERGINFNFQVSPKGVSDSNESQKKETKDSDNGDDELEDQFGVLEIDTSDNEIHFQIPPQVKKVFKKSKNPVMAANDCSQVKTKSKIKKSKKSNLKDTEETVKTKKLSKNLTKNLKEKNKVKNKTLKEVTKTEKSTSLRKKNRTTLNLKKLKMKKAENAKVLIKKKINLEKKSLANKCRKLPSKISGEEKKNDF